MTDQVEDNGDDAAEQERIEQRARVQGWRPQEEYRGPKAGWVDAETFLARGEEIRGFTKKENEALKRELAATKAALEEQGRTIEEIREYHAGMEKRAIEGAIKRLKNERREAVEAGNHALAADLDDDIEELRNAPSTVPGKKDAAAPAPSPSPTEVPMPPEVKQWHVDNASWYNQDEENEDLVAYADGMAKKIGTMQGLTVQERLDKLTEKVKTAFPDRFGGRKQATGVTAGAGEGGGRSGSRHSNKSVSALPDDARKAGERYVKQKLYKNLEEYAEEYFKQPGARA